MTSLLVVANAAAGTADRATLDRALLVLGKGAAVELVTTASPDELDAVLATAGDRIVVVAGGDGSLHAVVSALHSRGDLAGRTLGLLPLGTGNDFARGTGVPLDIEEAARTLLSGTPTPVALLVDDRGEVVVNNVHAGAGAAASRIGAAAKERLGTVGLGRLGYPLGALVTAVRPPTVRLRVVVDDQVLADPAEPTLMVALGNGPRVGGGAPINPDADPEDGVVDVVLTKPLGPLSRIGYAAQLAVGRHPGNDRVVHVTGRTVTVRGEGFWCSADGELEGPVTARTWRIVPSAYSLLLP
ncbi:diacylglycerol/lipid kinase family protein [Nocardioides jiangxiensis]|uniref:Diacylglycerol kinase family protein n=1 Tax=Nocardioides jiangxiensis TaxID=3064524 RepID=A0ABT9B112_9ACTN|nr:diacylglycerol kinase family protein [Nocardioides sp. WY-20]MDO7867928.1 diacylglycerol kinase family protein [Nocardioides sp. WY-20]